MSMNLRLLLKTMEWEPAKFLKETDIPASDVRFVGICYENPESASDLLYTYIRIIMFSASCHYGLQAMFHIAMHSVDGNNVELSEIATEQDIPKHFLSKILQQLVKQKLLVSMKGPNGGFRLSRPPRKIAIIDVVEAIDGLDIFNQCGYRSQPCDESDPCPIHSDYKKIRERVYNLFLTTSLEVLIGDLEDGNGELNLEKSGNGK